MLQRPAISPLRLKSAIRAIKLVSGPRFEEVVSKSDTVETPIATITGPLPVVQVAREQVVQIQTVNPSILNFTAERQRRLLAGTREALLGSTLRLADGIYEVDDIFYHPQDISRMMARVHMLYGGRL